MEALYIVRHGEALPHGTPGIADDDRPLTEKGEKQVRKVGKGLRRLDLKVDRIITSPLPRALRTAEILADVLKLSDQLETADVLRVGQGAASIRDWLSNRSEVRLMIVGHNPAFSDLAALLATGSMDTEPFLDLKKAGIAAFEAADFGRLRLSWLATPELIRKRPKP